MGAKHFLILILLGASAAHADDTTAAYACAFKNPVLFGASNTAGYASIWDGLKGRKAGQHGENYRASSLYPMEETQQNLFGEVHSTNIAEVAAGASPHNGFGSEQLAAYRATIAGQERVDHASAVMSLDAFYWQTAEGKCNDALNSADSIISEMKAKHKPLVLATVPDEDPRLVSTVLKLAGWVKPDPACVTQLNAKLKAQCHSQDQCYLLDLHDMVAKLNGPGVWFENHLNRSANIRFDGIHLSERGKRFISQLIGQKMKERPPDCAREATYTQVAAGPDDLSDAGR